MSEANLRETPAWNREADIRRRMNRRNLKGRKNREIADLLEEIERLRNALTAHLKAGCTLLEETPK